MIKARGSGCGWHEEAVEGNGGRSGCTTWDASQGRIPFGFCSRFFFLFFFWGGFNFTMSKIMIFIPLIKFLLKLITNIENVKDWSSIIIWVGAYASDWCNGFNLNMAGKNFRK